jgi:hypothetical protein
MDEPPNVKISGSVLSRCTEPGGRSTGGAGITFMPRRSAVERKRAEESAPESKMKWTGELLMVKSQKIKSSDRDGAIRSARIETIK